MIINLSNRLKDFLPGIILNILDIYEIVLAGGAIRAYLNKEEISDYDFFFFKADERNKVKDFLLSKRFRIVFECPNGKLITFKKKRLKIQLITERYYTNVYDLLESFDFTITQFVLYRGLLYTTKQALKDTYTKKIRFHKITYPSATLGRFYKFQNKGYHLDSIAKNDFINRILQNQNDVIDLNRTYVD